MWNLKVLDYFLCVPAHELRYLGPVFQTVLGPEIPWNKYISNIRSIWFLHLNKTSLNAKCGVEDLRLLPVEQALTNQLHSNVRPQTPVLHYMFVNILPYQNICTHWWSKNILHSFYKHSAFLGQPQYGCFFQVSANRLEIAEST